MNIDTKRIREQLFMTQDEFAKAIGVSVVSVSKWERGINKPTLKFLKVIVELARDNGIYVEGV
jgi:DNA-binding transcriptional regulator YiaG